MGKFYAWLQRGLLLIPLWAMGALSAAAQSGPLLTAEQNRPPAIHMLDCKDAPTDAVTKLPQALARWATIYCTKDGHLFSANDQYIALYPGAGLRANVSAAKSSGRGGGLGHSAYFRKVTYTHMPAKAVRDLATAAGSEAGPLIRAKTLFRLDLTTDTGRVVSMIVADPQDEVFWVFPVIGERVGKVAHYVASLAFVNRARR